MLNCSFVQNRIMCIVYVNFRADFNLILKFIVVPGGGKIQF